VVEHVVIIGSGPSGWTAAIYASRASLNPLVFEGAITEENRQAGTLPLGQLALTTEVENYPGFPAGDLEGFLDSSIEKSRRQYMAPHMKEGVSGPELMELMKQQALNFGTRVITDDIVEVDFDVRPFKLTARSGDVTEAHTVIIATGASANYLGLESEHNFKNRGVSACAVCDGALPRFRDQPVIVIGGGDSAVEEADYLAKFASKVMLVHRRDELRASKIMAQRALDNPKIDVVWNSAVEEVLGDDLVTGVKLKNLQTGDESTLDVDGMFLAIGHDPNTNIFQGHIEMDEKNYVVVKSPTTETSVEGVFAAGDVVDYVYQQAVTAAGQGCQAALDAEHWLESREV
jgi:thioredoxin reductase (NADPH)